MGVETDQEVVQLVGSEPYYADMMSSSIEECCSLQVFTQTQALEYIGNRAKQRQQQRKPKPKAISSVFFSFLHFAQG